MKPRLKSSPAARALIKAHTPFDGEARPHGNGGWVIGYGHTASAREGGEISAENADLLMIYDVLQAEQAIEDSIEEEVPTPQLDALVSFSMGIGLAAFKTSQIPKLINEKRWDEAAEAISAYGNGSARQESEREQFEFDLPVSLTNTPVDLIIEFEHPANDMANASEPAAEVQPEPDPEPVPDTPVAPVRSAIAARVIDRMRAQLVNEPPVAEEAESESQAIEAPVPDPEPDFAIPARLGYSYLTPANTPEDPANEEGVEADTPPLPPIPQINVEGAGEAAGNPPEIEEVEHSEEEDDLPSPDDFDSSFTQTEPDRNGNGWSNGDNSPAPKADSGRWGVIGVLAAGLVCLGVGAWDTISQFDIYWATRTLFWGPLVFIVGAIFTAGAAMSLTRSQTKS